MLWLVTWELLLSSEWFYELICSFKGVQVHFKGITKFLLL